ncbi:MAG: MTH938/NDUFAF3 family protein [Deltaproteobacteria bacterium]|nr:MTH938/NDUFAF3 family protein [Deltaproteobacteria bacterium]
MPRIDAYSAGRMTVDGEEYKRDLKIIGDRVIPEWWRDQDHRLNINDVDDVLSSSPETLVVDTGYAENMQLEKSLVLRLEKDNIRLVAQDTETAVKSFNDLREQGKDVAGAFHLTC